jgi:2,4-dienoyl-CoA reductase-like NADH-dependent reductase (Old Yellow Enzyme family)
LPLFVRISATDWADGGWDIDAIGSLARSSQAARRRLIDVSSGGARRAPADRAAARLSGSVRGAHSREAAIATGAVGLITEPEQADEIVRSGQADIVLLARELLRDPYWPLHAATRSARGRLARAVRTRETGSRARRVRRFHESLIALFRVG